MTVPVELMGWKYPLQCFHLIKGDNILAKILNRIVWNTYDTFFFVFFYENYD